MELQLCAGEGDFIFMSLHMCTDLQNTQSRSLPFLCELVAQLCPTLCEPVNCTHRTPLSMGFPRQEYVSGLSFPPPGHLPDPEIKPGSPALKADSLFSDQVTSHLVLSGPSYFCTWQSNNQDDQGRQHRSADSLPLQGAVSRAVGPKTHQHVGKSFLLLQQRGVFFFEDCSPSHELSP